ncbi:MAG: serine hydrolase [Gemmatimonadetes bacterium]|nr:serine hydrolase [Gemmatimonadota bacterium]
MRRYHWMVAAGLLVAPAVMEAQGRAAMVARIDSLVGVPIAARRIAGASVAVVKGRDTILIKGYGWADLELEVPTPPNAVYEVGSVTKQFTTAAILQLAEQGKLSLDDDLTKYLPDYPTQAHRISIRRLMDHTSGIKGYTEIPEARSLFMLKLSRDSIVGVFSRKPFEFAPGDALVYNNSAYFLLGLIIEKVSGMSYQEYLQKQLLDRVGMTSSSYCSESAITRRKVRGFNAGPQGLVKAYQQDHVWPYSAGSLCSTAGDLIAWLRELHRGGQVVTRSAYRELITPGTLNDGTRLRYAKGLTVVEEDGRVMISHGGGISGFVSETRYYPAEDLSVVVLINTAGGADPSEMARAIARIVIGPGSPPPAAVAYPGDLAELAGRYRGVGRGAPVDLTLVVEGGALKARQGNGPPRDLRYLGDGVFHGTGRDRYRVIREGGRVVALQLDLVSVVTRLARQS